MMICANCGSQKAWHKEMAYDEETKKWLEWCDGCGLEGAGTGVPDVYLAYGGQKFENLCDPMGRPYEVTSKRHKKILMDRLGVSEAGDKVHGAPADYKPWIEGTRPWRKRQFEKDRPVLREVYKTYLNNVRRKT